MHTVKMRTRSTFGGGLLLVAALILVGCGSNAASSGATSLTPPPANVSALPTATHCGAFTKVKIVAHLGIAYFAFQHYLYSPWKSGQFRKGTPGRTKSIVKGVVAGLVGLHEFQRAVGDLHQCGTGQSMSTLLTAAQAQLTGLRGSANASAANSQINSQMRSLTKTYNKLQAAA